MSPRTLGIMPPATVVARARSAIGKGIHYDLGKGGRDPFAALPSGAGLLCDCSGFAAWCAGVDRFLPNDGGIPHLEGAAWFETTALVRDAIARGLGFCDAVRWQFAHPGDLVVFGDSRGTDDKIHQGHVGVVATADGEGPLSVVHCSTSNDRLTGDAIRETTADVFARNHALVARLAWVREVVA
jgi:hypothetical protein